MLLKHAVNPSLGARLPPSLAEDGFRSISLPKALGINACSIQLKEHARISDEGFAMKMERTSEAMDGRRELQGRTCACPRNLHGEDRPLRSKRTYGRGTLCRPEAMRRPVVPGIFMPKTDRTELEVP